MYILLYVQDKQPCFIQGTLKQINATLADLWEAGVIDREDWEYYGSYDLLYIEDGKLTKVNSWEAVSIPTLMVN